MAQITWSHRDKLKGYELLVDGYVRKIEHLYKVQNSVNDAAPIIVSYVAPLLLLGLDLHHQYKLNVSEDKLTLRGNDGNNHQSYLIYAECDNYDNIGYNKGIHCWSVECIAYYENLWSFNLIGIKSERKRPWVYEKWTKVHEGGLYYHLDNGLGKMHWPSNTITIRLNCYDWTLTYFNGLLEIQKDYIKPNQAYYFVLQISGNDKSHFRVVPTPNKLK